VGPRSRWARSTRHGTGLQRLTFPSQQHDFGPSFSPAGDLIVFERDVRDFSTGDVYVMNPDGSGLTLIQHDAFEPAWGPLP
jgi:Tol biopolymer transport system component